MHIDKITDGLIDNHGEIIAIRNGSDSAKIRGLQKRIAREFAEKSKVSFTSLTPPFQVVKVCR